MFKVLLAKVILKTYSLLSISFVAIIIEHWSKLPDTFLEQRTKFDIFLKFGQK